MARKKPLSEGHPRALARQHANQEDYVIDEIGPTIARNTKLVYQVLMRVTDTVKETLADVSSASPSSELHWPDMS